VDVVGVAGGSLLVYIIEAPHPLHTHRRSTLYIIKCNSSPATVASGLSMQLQPDIRSMEPKVEVLGVKAGFSVGSYD
jgi:hypothetical protein